MIRNKKVQLYIIIVLSMVFWGMSFVWSTIVFRYLAPITTVFFRLIISSAILFAGLKLFGKFEKVKRAHYKMFLISALFNPFLYFLGENFGLKNSSATISAVIIATIPVFSPIAAYFFLKERLSLLNIGGLIVSFAGVLVMLVNNASGGSSLPMLSVFASSLAFVFFAIGTREIGVSKTSIFSNLIPAITAIGSYFLLGEAFSIQKGAGILMVICGLSISQLNRRQPAPLPEAVFEG
jgi:drug/metabolite transporter (DMT)-like permease